MVLADFRLRPEAVKDFSARLAAAALLLLAGGCGESISSYQAPGDHVAEARRILVLPFLDTRTFVDERDPHRDDLGEHARGIFAAALRESQAGSGAEIILPPLPRREESISIAEAAELGRLHHADLVVAGQAFSFTETRAASIPPRAGMFVRVVSARDGVLLFVGDGYQAASLPGAGGGRELQAKNVAARLADGLALAGGRSLPGEKAASTRALAQLISDPASVYLRGGYYREEEDARPGEGDGAAPEPLDAPPSLDDGGESASNYETAADAASETAAADPEPVSGPKADASATDRETAAREADSEGGAEAGETAGKSADGGQDDYYEAMDIDELALSLTGDDLAEDILAEGEELLAGAHLIRPSIRKVEAEPEADGDISDSSVLAAVAGPKGESGSGPEAALAVSADASGGTPVSVVAVSWEEPDAAELAAWLLDDGPVASVPLAAEQPRPAVAANAGRPARVLLLPYHDRDNPHNLIPHTGGGEVVTSIMGSRLADNPEIQLLWDATGQAGHGRLLDREEAIRMAGIAGADYVVRGQVVEFRRAQSVPSLYSAVISTAILAAQIVFAEMSGVDIATEVYRVSDGRCLVSRRDRAQQKYVVQAERTVRRLAAGAAENIFASLATADPDEMEPLIETLSPATVFSNPY